MKVSVALLFSGLVAQQVSATWNRRAGRFNTPQYNNNECTNKQKEGYNWIDLPRGDFSGYEDFNFKGGWTCAERFGKRDSLTKRTFNSKCIKNKVRKEKPAAFDCKKKDGFSVTEFQVSVEFDTDLEFHYKMPDNSICKQIAPCKKEGTIVRNTQCGGAREVEVYLGRHNQKDREDCEIGFHHIGFDCSPPYVPSEPPASSPPAQTSSPLSRPETSAAPPPASETSVVTSETPAPTETPSPPVQTPIYRNSTFTTRTPVETPVQTPVEIPVQTPSLGIGTTETTTKTPEAVSSTTSESSSLVAPPSVSSSPPANPGVTPPECLPKCMNTWLEINSKCKDNTDANCYCKNPEFTKSVIECVAAWATDAETQQALQYLLGICASHVPENPGLITDCPTYIPLNPPTPPATPAPIGSAPPVPVTTITYDTTLTKPCSCAASTDVTSTISTTVTVPQVIFTTETPAQPPAPGVTPPEAPVALVPGTPPSVPAVTTPPVAPFPSNNVPTSLSTIAAPSASASFSPPLEFQGAASTVRIGFVGTVFGAVFAIIAL
ncbi:uncharacterized protein EI97DRAFT_109605 [Westerdykella ornata]|uniref:CFEM domain-containing protein n=1 Tax=Westerdykella ornata TaxID=318751 RepID=A0A6A6JV30_WESOR|nr:uncharacterized protein EI97DRAFT_109605 [Westerdykella ornata]KAF2280074.1 hypothetical protein EI97DRAFT_109605 [Westerdykella ornata]